MQSNSLEVERTEAETCLLTLPAERSTDFLETFARISVALQAVLRERVPAIYFNAPGRYREWKSAYPMLLYQASRPYRGRVRTELTYDVLNPRLMTVLFRRAKSNLGPLLERVEAELRAAGFDDIAGNYLSRRTLEIIESVQRLSASRRCLYRLVRGESALVDALVDLSGWGTLSTKEQSKRLLVFRKKWQFQLRRLYPGGDFSELAPILLETAERALHSDGPTGAEADSNASLTVLKEPGSGEA